MQAQYEGLQRAGGVPFLPKRSRAPDLDDWGPQTTRRILAEEPPEWFDDSYRAE